MQTPNSNRPVSLEVPSKTSPAASRPARPLKTPGSGSVSPASRTPKDRSPKVVERRLQRSPVTEKKRPSKVSELESQVARLQDDLKKTKDQLDSSESCKKEAEVEAEETKKQLLAMSAKLEESEKQLLELSTSEDAQVLDIQKKSDDRDEAWASEFETFLKEHSSERDETDSTVDEIQKLENQHGQVAEPVVSLADVQRLQLEFSETLDTVGKMKAELDECKESEATARKIVSETNLQFESAKASVKALRAEGFIATEAYGVLALQLEQSKARVVSLEELVGKLQTSSATSNSKCSQDPSETAVQAVNENDENGETMQLKEELTSAKLEVYQLRSTLEVAEARHLEQYVQSNMHIRNAYEQVEQAKSESGLREAELETELKNARSNIEELMEKLMEKETIMQHISNENERLNIEIARNRSSQLEVKKSKSELADLKASLMVEETEVQTLAKENEMLKEKIEKSEMDKNKSTDEAIALAESARAAEREALMKLAYLKEEAEKNSRRAARMTEQLDAAQTANSEMEAELRRLKVQSDQWRKAAEAAAAMISSGNNGKFVERAGSLDNNNNNNNYHSIGMKLGSPFSDDTDDISPKKKNGNMLKKIGVLWKKSQK